MLFTCSVLFKYHLDIKKIKTNGYTMNTYNPNTLCNPKHTLFTLNIGTNRPEHTLDLDLMPWGLHYLPLVPEILGTSAGSKMDLFKFVFLQYSRDTSGKVYHCTGT